MSISAYRTVAPIHVERIGAVDMRFFPAPSGRLTLPYACAVDLVALMGLSKAQSLNAYRAFTEGDYCDQFPMIQTPEGQTFKLMPSDYAAASLEALTEHLHLPRRILENYLEAAATALQKISRTHGDDPITRVHELLKNIKEDREAQQMEGGAA